MWWPPFTYARYSSTQPSATSLSPLSSATFFLPGLPTSSVSISLTRPVCLTQSAIILSIPSLFYIERKPCCLLYSATMCDIVTKWLTVVPLASSTAICRFNSPYLNAISITKAASALTMSVVYERLFHPISRSTDSSNFQTPFIATYIFMETIIRFLLLHIV